jgi:hypothetical protein
MGTGMNTGRTAGHNEFGSTGYGTGSAEGAHGPHSSRVANAMDPRVDSDRDGSRTAGGMGGGMGGMGTGRTAGHNEFGSTGYGTGSAEGAHGPHSSRVANAMDPRVDSDRDGSRTAGGMGGMNTGRTAGHGEFGSTGYGTGSAEGAHGPHSSRVANAMDPRVDSDRDGSRTAGTGAGYGSSTHHTTGLGSGMTGHTSHSGPGPAPNTAGPHSSDMANKMDPRVDSDLDGSKTMGGNKTYGQ